VEGDVAADKDLSEPDDKLLDAWQAGTYQWRPLDDHLIWSRELISIYGLDEAPPAEQGFMARVHPEDRVRVEGETSAYLGSRASSYSHRFRIVRPDGAVRLILDRGAIERDAAGNVRVIRGINIDITDEAELDPSQRHGTAAGDGGGALRWHPPHHNAPAIIFDWDIPANRVKRLLGDHPTLPKTTEHPDTLENVTAAVHPADRAAFRAAVDAALASPDGRYSSMHRVTGPHGAVDWFAESGCVEFDADKAPLRLVGFSHVVSEGERQGGASAETHAILSALFESAPVGLGVWDGDFRFLRVNPELAAINGLPVEAHLGRRPDELMPGLVDFEGIYRRWREILETGEPWLGVEISGETPAEPGRQRHWEEHFFPLRIGGRNARHRGCRAGNDAAQSCGGRPARERRTLSRPVRGHRPGLLRPRGAPRRA
jgi:PAS domain S-box-containing protein